ncbi:BZ3500_MvSof-1268-A1-R1_Chr2-1g04623 [Microbotryum saponariae]|uniref:BZ3500_MvSof-1268-A1-R1_Chr2-1g04623 protein n=1 Tax=Microbotryum saponariae TaxID=289078 RepID=A0A2X0MC70_9BASI|nr:BZ3500_MvSof-1268-A1-R1_Chr2-1g04623 [Microbotryum saponariae]SCZ92143.1 BZ3501_MvSof-1269-A2-R1_Chr2-1g04279 [Microbotryum saponariae]
MTRPVTEPQVQLDGPPQAKRVKLSPSIGSHMAQAATKTEPQAKQEPGSTNTLAIQAQGSFERSVEVERALLPRPRLPVKPAASGPSGHDSPRVASSQTDTITLEVPPNPNCVPELTAAVIAAQAQLAHPLPLVPTHPVPQSSAPTKSKSRRKRPKPPKPPKPANQPKVKVRKSMTHDDDPMQALRPRRNPFSTLIPPHPVFWRSPGIQPNLAALPPPLLIKSLDLRLQSVTHLSYYLNGSNNVRLSKEESYVKCFRPLEWFGDAELKHYVANILVKKFPSLTHASYTLLAAMLIQNDTISYIAWAYGLGDLMLFGKVAHGEESFAHHQDALANLFEAMLGALVKDRGSEGEAEIKDWMGKIFSDEVFPELNERAEAMKEWPLKEKLPDEAIDVLAGEAVVGTVAVT